MFKLSLSRPLGSSHKILKYTTNALDKDLIYEDKGNTQIVGYLDIRPPSNRCSTLGYCVLVGGNLISWRRNKNVVARSNVEAKYRTMTIITFQLIQLQKLKKLKFQESSQMHLMHDN